jgi:hypothetical protein
LEKNGMFNYQIPDICLWKLAHRPTWGQGPGSDPAAQHALNTSNLPVNECKEIAVGGSRKLGNWLIMFISLCKEEYAAEAWVMFKIMKNI